LFRSFRGAEAPLFHQARSAALRAPFMTPREARGPPGARKDFILSSFRGAEAPLFHRRAARGLSRSTALLSSGRYAFGCAQACGARKGILGNPFTADLKVCSTLCADTFFTPADTFFAKKAHFLLDFKANKW
jgi:hypothetical protein